MRRAFVVLAALLALFATAAVAENKQPYLQAKDVYRIFVLGDSLAAGLGLGLARMADGDFRLAVDGRYKEESGLARPEFYDWNDALPKILESNEIEIAVILIGANDSRDIRSGGLRFVFGTQEWTNAYVAQTDRLIDGLKQAGAAVYWVEVPPMEAANYNAAMKAISIVQRERMQVKGVRFVETASAFVNANGLYDDMGSDDTGANVRLRDRDGVHFLKAGNNKLADLVLTAIRADIAIADGNPAKPEGPTGPVFGQEPAAGVANTVMPGIVPPGAAGVDAVQQFGPPLTREQAIAQTIPGSAAEKLFKLGEAPPAPPGRFDDFTAPQ